MRATASNVLAYFSHAKSAPRVAVAAGIACAPLLLVGCLPPAEEEIGEPPRPVMEEPSERSEAADPAEAPAAAQSATGTGAIPERMLPTGILDLGSRDAPLTLLAITEHHCRYCREFMEEHFPRVVRAYIDQGLLRYQVVILPLRKYANSRDAAAALLCAGAQGRGMAMHARLFGEAALDPPALAALAKELGLDEALFTACLGDPRTEELLTEQEAWIRSLAVEYVPTFFLNGGKFVGLPYEADLRGRIERALRDAQSASEEH